MENTTIQFVNAPITADGTISIDPEWIRRIARGEDQAALGFSTVSEKNDVNPQNVQTIGTNPARLVGDPPS